MPRTSLRIALRLRGFTSRWAVVICVLGGVFVGGCGDPVIGGGGDLSDRMLYVRGTPYQMGWWHGKLLGDRIRSLHARWQRHAYEAAAGAKEGASGGAVEQLRKDILLFTDQSLERLPERARRELEGLSAASGIAQEDLLAMSVMRDGLRIRANTGPGLPGMVAAAPGPQAFVKLTGPVAGMLADEWLLIRRDPVGGVATIVVTWPGSLGGIAGLSGANVGFVSAEIEVDVRRRGFGKGLSFDVAARLALEESRTAEEFFAKGSSTAGHAIFAINLRPDPDELDAVAMGSVEAYVSIDERPFYLGDRDFIAMPPYPRDHDEQRRAFFKRMRTSSGTASARFDALWSSSVDAFESRGPGFQIVIGSESGASIVHCTLGDGTSFGHSGELGRN